MEKSILIVEDEHIVASDLKEVLEAEGWRVIGPAATVNAALRFLAGDNPSVALLDAVPDIIVAKVVLAGGTEKCRHITRQMAG